MASLKQPDESLFKPRQIKDPIEMIDEFDRLASV
jgi:hypothetical protein